MPSTSKKQHNFMAAIAHNPGFAKKVGVPQSVGKDFNDADKGKTFKQGGTMATKKKMDPKMMAALMSARQPKMPMADAAAPAPMAAPGGMGGMKRGGMAMKKMAGGGMAKEDSKMDKAQDKAMIKKAFGMHDKQEHKGGKGTDLAKLKKGGMAMKKMAMGGKTSQLSKANGVASKGKTKGTMIKMSKGGRSC
jgi:hypothetical protein